MLRLGGVTRWCAESCEGRWLPCAGRQSVRHKMFKHKGNRAARIPVRTPTALALDHFDFYYRPMFAEKWPSIRLGLLTPRKYVAVLNTFSKSWDVNEGMLKELGCFNLLEASHSPTETALSSDAEEGDVDAAADRSSTTSWTDKSNETVDEATLRSEAGLLEFRPSEKIISRPELGSRKGRVHQSLDKLTITGLEGRNIELATKDCVVTYPSKLTVFAFERCNLVDFPSPHRDDRGIPSWWLLDGGSILPVLALNLTDGESVLDMCASPGGKSLVMIQTGLPGKLVCNDFKLSRLGMLRRALATYVPLDCEMAEKVILKRKDASSLSKWDELDQYDKVLVDAPCTTDRLVVNQDDGNLFATSMTTERLNLPQLQTKLLINGLRSVRVGGSVVYSTCSLSAVQNEGVVENAAAICEEQFGIRVEELSLKSVVSSLSSSGLFNFDSRCRRGALVLPFLPSNFGPTYVCKLQRIE